MADLTYSDLINAFSKIRDNAGIRKAAELLAAQARKKYRQFTYEVSGGDFHFIKNNVNDTPVMALLPLE